MNSPALAKRFTDAEFTPKQSDALIYAFKSGHEKLVTREHFDHEQALTREYLALIRERLDSHAERMDRELALTREHMDREHALTRERMDSHAERMDALTEHMKREQALTREQMNRELALTREQMDSNIKRLEDKLTAAQGRTHVHLMVTALSGISLILAAIGIAAALLPMGSP